MSRYRLYPSPEQAAVLLEHCAQQALRDFDRAMRNFYAGTHGHPGRRRRHVNEGFRITDFTFSMHVRRLNRRWGQIWVPKCGWVRFRWTRAVPECRSYRVTFDGSPEQQAERRRIARLRVREADRRKDWCEKTSTDLARRFDVIRFEELNIRNMTRSAKGTVKAPGMNVRQKAGLNRSILAQGWGLLVRRTEDKALGRVEKVRAACTSMRCSACGWIDKDSRDSQAGFCCVSCGFTCNADINASINIAAGHAGGTPLSVREPQLLASLTGRDAVEIPASGRGRMSSPMPTTPDEAPRPVTDPVRRGLISRETDRKGDY